jgi:hypothetical protein
MLSSLRTFAPFCDLHKVTKVVEYKRRYEQVLTTEPKYSPQPPHKPIAGELRIIKKMRDYYMQPRWQKRHGSCDCPVVPNCFDSYYRNKDFEDEAWSSDDEEGVREYYVNVGEELGGYDKKVFTESILTNEEIKKGKILIPYSGVVTKESFHEDHGTKIASRCGDVFKRRYDSDYDSDDPYASPERPVKKVQQFKEGKFKTTKNMETRIWKFEFEEAAYDKVDEELQWRLLHDKLKAFFCDGECGAPEHWMLVSEVTFCYDCMHDPCVCMSELKYDIVEKAYFRYDRNNKPLYFTGAKKGDKKDTSAKKPGK